MTDIVGRGYLAACPSADGPESPVASGRGQADARRAGRRAGGAHHEAWFKLTEFGTDAPLEQHVFDVRRQGRADLVAALRELEELAPGSVGHGGSVVLSGVLRRLAQDEPLVLAFLAAEALAALADARGGS